MLNGSAFRFQLVNTVRTVNVTLVKPVVEFTRLKLPRYFYFSFFFPVCQFILFFTFYFNQYFYILYIYLYSGTYFYFYFKFFTAMLHKHVTFQKLKKIIKSVSILYMYLFGRVKSNKEMKLVRILKYNLKYIYIYKVDSENLATIIMRFLLLLSTPFEIKK